MPATSNELYGEIRRAGDEPVPGGHRGLALLTNEAHRVRIAAQDEPGFRSVDAPTIVPLYRHAEAKVNEARYGPSGPASPPASSKS